MVIYKKKALGKLFALCFANGYLEITVRKTFAPYFTNSYLEKKR
jgi:hypothetical protein